MYRTNDDGIAYGFAAIAMLIFVAAILWIVLGVVANGMIDTLNDQAAGGTVSVQTMSAVGLAVTMFRYGPPIFVLLVAFYYGIVRALYRRQEEVSF